MPEQYNGWTNYATWRVNLEICDDEIQRLIEDGETFDSVERLARYLQRDAEDSITQDGTAEGCAVDYALSFLDDVNWDEIALHAADDLVGTRCDGCDALYDPETTVDGPAGLCPACAANDN